MHPAQRFLANEALLDERCTAALLTEVDPVGLVRKTGGPPGEGGLLDQYVNDRPYVSSSFTDATSITENQSEKLTVLDFSPYSERLSERSLER